MSSPWTGWVTPTQGDIEVLSMLQDEWYWLRWAGPDGKHWGLNPKPARFADGHMEIEGRRHTWDPELERWMTDEGPREAVVYLLGPYIGRTP